MADCSHLNAGAIIGAIDVFVGTRSSCLVKVVSGGADVLQRLMQFVRHDGKKGSEADIKNRVGNPLFQVDRVIGLIFRGIRIIVPSLHQLRSGENGHQDQ